ncbi:MAG: tetratricopeptide repeat protein [Candidatus Omnitrophota bacterium]|nr:tetratricopeptide repeat protein [Candidatus Omnitrophota bacterium]
MGHSLSFARFVEWLKIVCQRAMVFYALVFLVVNATIDYDRIYFGIKVRLVERIFPAKFNTLILVEQQEKNPTARELMPYINFYKRIVDYFPDQADAWSMLGFCYYYLGDSFNALWDYEQALKQQPEYFWFAFNIGTIYFRSGNFSQSIPYFEKAIKTNPDKNLEYILSSKVVYRSLLWELPKGAEELKARLKIGYQRSYLALILSSYQLQNYAAMLNYAESALLSNVGLTSDFTYFAGLAAYKLNQWDKALKYFEASAKQNPQHAHTFYQWGLTLQSLNKNKEAAAKLNQASELKQQLGLPVLGEPILDYLAKDIFVKIF